MSDVLSHLQGEGYFVSDFVPDGKIHRFKVNKNDNKKNGWAVGYQNFTRSGELFQFVVYGDWSSGIGHKTYSTLNGTATAEDKKFIDSKIDEAKRKNQIERENIWNESAKIAQEKIESLPSTGRHDYLEKKQISDIDLGIKFCSFSNSLFIPLKDMDGKIWSYQEIDWKSEKRYLSGGKKSGNFHVIGDIGERIYFCEGFSTGASIFKAVKTGVVVCMDAGGIEPVVSQFRKKYPETDFIICGDDDTKKEGENKGRETAEAVANKYFCTAVFPEFKIKESHYSDFNDLHCVEGLSKVSEQLRIKEDDLSEIFSINYLGYSGEIYYFSSSYNKQVIGFSALTDSNLIKLMPISYWDNCYPGKRGIDWQMAKDELIANCHKKGLFSPKNVRGSGVWLDEGRIVINMGDHLIVDGKKTLFNKLKSKYFYTLGSNLSELHKNKLSKDECKLLVDICMGFKWVKPEYGMLLAGGLVISRICGILPIRPHIWITGGAETGKTTLLEKLVQVILGENKLYVQGSTTEAGVRQSLKADAIPVLFDEFETNGRGSDENIANLIELMRASWSDSHAAIVKGGSGGQASHYQVRFSAIVSSIRTRLINDADKGRFAVVELLPHGGDADHWAHLSGLLGGINAEYSERLFSRTISMSKILLENFKVIRLAFAKKAGSRFGDQYGMLLAGYCTLIYDDLITQSEADFFIDQFNLEDEKNDSKDKDHDDALNHLLTTKISYESIGASRSEDSIGGIIAKVMGASGESCYAEKKALINLGIKAEFDSISIIQANHNELEKTVWRNTKWSGIWGKSLSRISGSEKNRVVRFPGLGVKKCVKVPLFNIKES